MASPTTPTSKRRGSFASIANSAKNFTEDLVMRNDPPLGFFAATAQTTSKAPTIGDIRTGSFGQDGWQTSGSTTRSRQRTTSSSKKLSKDSKEQLRSEGEVEGFVEPFAPLTEEPSSITNDAVEAISGEREESKAVFDREKHDDTELRMSDPTPSTSAEQERTNNDRIIPITYDHRTHSSGYIPPPKIPWTTSTWIGLKAFWKWFTTPFGFLFTIYGLNVVAWGGMLFLLLCNASPAMCHAPVPRPSNQKHMSDVAALKLPGPYYFNCDDINSPRRVWIEIDSQILNALFCVTGLGLVPWRFRDLYYLLRWRLTSEKSQGRERKMYGLRVLAGIHKNWFRLPGSETLDARSTQEYLKEIVSSSSPTAQNEMDLESSPTTYPEQDPRIPLPISKRPADPATSIRAPPTAPWKLDFFIWCQVWNTFFQCCLCGFMWGQNRYARVRNSSNFIMSWTITDCSLFSHLGLPVCL